mmetsp:Transcript_8266/g.29255  ORF Transcript_8266/g.29255 Transcript_8266/m.29255 type:complete len:200 (+) Transcript_8266:978-1577(+)
MSRSAPPQKVDKLQPGQRLQQHRGGGLFESLFGAVFARLKQIGDLRSVLVAARSVRRSRRAVENRLDRCRSRIAFENRLDLEDLTAREPEQKGLEERRRDALLPRRGIVSAHATRKLRRHGEPHHVVNRLQRLRLCEAAHLIAAELVPQQISVPQTFVTETVEEETRSRRRFVGLRESATACTALPLAHGRQAAPVDRL